MAPSNPTDYDKQQDQQQGLRIQNLQNKLTGVETDVVQQGAQATTLQRLRINVPNPSTHFLLGQRVTGTTPFGYTGASLEAAGNLFIDIKEDTVVQTKGFSLMQTDSVWQQYSKGLMELSSPVSVKVTGGQVFLGSISDVPSPSFKANNGQKLQINSPVNLGPVFEHVKAVGGFWDAGLTAIGLAMSTLFFSAWDKLDVHSNAKSLETAISMGLKVWGLGEKGVDYLFEPPQKPKHDVTIFGQEGVAVMSPEKLSFTTERSMKLFARTGISLTSGASTSIMSMQGVKCFGLMKAALEGGAYTDVKAGAELGVSCLRGKLKLRGKKIDIGTGAPKWSQVATEDLRLVAMKTIKIGAVNEKVPDEPESEKGRSKLAKFVNPKTKDTEVALTKNITLSATEKILLESKDTLHGKAKQKVKVQVGIYLMEITPEGITIGVGADADPKNPIIKIDKKSITLNSSGMEMKVGKQMVSMGEGRNKLSIDKSGQVSLRGKVLKLG